MYLQDFKYYQPESLEEAFKLLEESKNGAPLAGGTDMLVEIKKGLRQQDEVISLKKIKELKVIEEDGSNLYIGACSTHNEVKNSSLIKTKIPAISEAASAIGSDQVRNTATIGGNICTGASCCDMAPVLLACNASVEITSSKDKRIVSLKDFFIFHKETSIKKGEILTRIIVPLPEPGTGICFIKYGLRQASSISVASASVMIKLDGDICKDSCVVIGAVAPTPRISTIASEVLNGAGLNNLKENSFLDEAGSAAVKDSLPIDDIRGSAEFRRNLVKVLTRRAIIKSIERAEQSLKK